MIVATVLGGGNPSRLVAGEQISRRGDGNLDSPYFLSHFFSMMRVSAVSLKLLPAGIRVAPCNEDGDLRP
jgi:hypothetical protein